MCMTIPNQVKIGGLVYKVKMVDNCPLGYDYSGEISQTKEKIYIQNGASDNSVKETLLHEIIHGMVYYMGLRGTDYNSESFVEGLAHVLLAVIEDNPEMFGNS